MTATQYAKAIIRAAKAGLQVAGQGTIKATGQRFIAVTSATGPACHLVRIAGDTLVCDCNAAANGQYCMHRLAVARARLAATVPPAAPVELRPGDGRSRDGTQRHANPRRRIANKSGRFQRRLGLRRLDAKNAK